MANSITAAPSILAESVIASLKGKLPALRAFSSVEKPILTPEQVAGHQVMWAEDNLKDYPYPMEDRSLPYDMNPVTRIGWTLVLPNVTTNALHNVMHELPLNRGMYARC